MTTFPLHPTTHLVMRTVTMTISCTQKSRMIVQEVQSRQCQRVHALPHMLSHITLVFTQITVTDVSH